MAKLHRVKRPSITQRRCNRFTWNASDQAIVRVLFRQAHNAAPLAPKPIAQFGDAFLTRCVAVE